jgi:hypothetical protein
MAGYNCSLVVWLSYCAMKSEAREDSQTLLRPQRWEQSLSDAHHPLPADSLIPMFEGMVDRALSRSQPESGTAREPRVEHDPVWKTESSASILQASGLRARAASKT